MKTPFVHTFRDQLNGEWKALAVAHGLNTYPVAIYEGRQCYVTDTRRVFGGKGRNYHNRYTVHFIDDGSVQSVPAGRFNKAAKTAPLPTN